MMFEIAVIKLKIMVGVCRICATIRQSDLLVVLTNECHKIYEILKNCLHFELKLNDGLPNTVCNECISTLEMINVFYEKLEQAEESLRAIFKEKTENVLTIALQVEKELVIEAEAEEENDDGEFDNSTVESEYLEEYELERLESVKADEVEHMEDVENVEIKNNDIPNTTQHIDSWSSYNWLCYLCIQPLSSYTELVQHALQKHKVTENKLRFRCSDCHKTCARYSIFFNHVRLHHHTELSCCCDICNLHCLNYEYLAQHRELCSSKKQQIQMVICKTCGIAFRSTHGYARHERLHHSNPAKSYDCQLCEKKFKRAFALRIHERVHCEAKDYSCHICGHAFRQKINLEMHMYAHSTEKKYECAICKKFFKTAANLDKHGLTHTQIKDFQCQFCERKFRNNDSRICHERIHTGQKPYKCEYCDQSFRFRSTFSSHLNVHTGERSYKCEECDHQFNNCSNYNKHMKRRHNVMQQNKL